MPGNNGIRKMETKYQLDDWEVFTGLARARGYTPTPQDNKVYLENDKAHNDVDGIIDRSASVLIVYHRDTRSILEALVDELVSEERTLAAENPVHG